MQACDQWMESQDQPQCNVPRNGHRFTCSTVPGCRPWSVDYLQVCGQQCCKVSKVSLSTMPSFIGMVTASCAAQSLVVGNGQPIKRSKITGCGGWSKNHTHLSPWLWGIASDKSAGRWSVGDHKITSHTSRSWEMVGESTATQCHDSVMVIEPHKPQSLAMGNGQWTTCRSEWSAGSVLAWCSSCKAWSQNHMQQSP